MCFTRTYAAEVLPFGVELSFEFIQLSVDILVVESKPAALQVQEEIHILQVGAQNQVRLLL